MTKIRVLALFLYMFSLNFEVFNLFGLGSASFFTGMIFVMTILSDFSKFISLQYFKKAIVPLLLFLTFQTFISFINFFGNDIVFFVDFTLALNILLFIILVNQNVLIPNALKIGSYGFVTGSLILTLFYNLGIGIGNFGGRVSIFGDNENSIAIKLCISILIIINFILFEKTKLIYKVVSALFIPLLLAFMLETGSRTGVVCLFVGILLFFFNLKGRSVSQKIIIFISIPFLIYFVVQRFMYSEIAQKRFERTIENSDLAGRDRIWKKIVLMIEENPITGHGVTGFTAMSTEAFGKFNSPHNVILEILVTTGMIGLSLFCFFMFKVFQNTWRSYIDHKFILPLVLFVCYLLIVMTSHTLENKLAWFMLAFCLSSYYGTKNLSNRKIQ